MLRVHNPDLVEFLSTAWKEYTAVVSDPQIVIGEMFNHEGLVEGMPVGRPPATNGYGRIGWFCFDTSSPLSEGSWPAALASADIALSGVDRLLGRRARRVLAVSPAGPPCDPIGLRRVLPAEQRGDRRSGADRRRARRVTVLDVDAHHGNGTQQIFYQRSDVQFVSIHMDPEWNYPWFVGRADERGDGRGAGANLNLPFHSERPVITT